MQISLYRAIAASLLLLGTVTACEDDPTDQDYLKDASTSGTGGASGSKAGTGGASGTVAGASGTAAGASGTAAGASGSAGISAGSGGSAGAIPDAGMADDAG